MDVTKKESKANFIFILPSELDDEVIVSFIDVLVSLHERTVYFSYLKCIIIMT